MGYAGDDKEGGGFDADQVGGDEDDQVGCNLLPLVNQLEGKVSHSPQYIIRIRLVVTLCEDEKSMPGVVLWRRQTRVWTMARTSAVLVATQVLQIDVLLYNRYQNHVNMMSVKGLKMASEDDHGRFCSFCSCFGHLAADVKGQKRG